MLEKEIIIGMEERRHQSESEGEWCISATHAHCHEERGEQIKEIKAGALRGRERELRQMCLDKRQHVDI